MPTSPTVIRTSDDIVRDTAFMDLNTKRSKVRQKRLGVAMGYYVNYGICVNFRRSRLLLKVPFKSGRGGRRGQAAP